MGMEEEAEPTSSGPPEPRVEVEEVPVDDGDDNAIGLEARMPHSACPAQLALLPHRRAPEARTARFWEEDRPHWAYFRAYGQDVALKEHAQGTMRFWRCTRRARQNVVATTVSLFAALIVLAVCLTGHSDVLGLAAQKSPTSTQDAMVMAQSHCFAPCGGKSGPCAWCGEGNACCRYGASLSASVPECRRVEHWSTTSWHTCVRPSGSSDAAVVMEFADRVYTNDTNSALILATELAHRRSTGEAAPRQVQGGYVAQDPALGGSYHDPDVDIAQCVIDAGQATYSLGKAGTAISAATRVCKDLWYNTWQGNYGTTRMIRERQTVDNKQATCSAAVSSILESLVFGAAFLADAAANCALGFNLQATCATDVTWFVGSLAQVASAASGLTQTCHRHSLAPQAAFDGRRLQGVLTPGNSTAALRALRGRGASDSAANSAPPSPSAMAVAGVAMSVHHTNELRATTLTECIFDAGQASLFFARAGTYIKRAVRDCGDSLDIACAVDVEFLLDAFSFVGSYISFAVSHCAAIKNMDALCVGNIMDTIAAVEGLAASATEYRRSCEKIENGEAGDELGPTPDNPYPGGSVPPSDGWVAPVVPTPTPAPASPPLDPGTPVLPGVPPDPGAPVLPGTPPSGVPGSVDPGAPVLPGAPPVHLTTPTPQEVPQPGEGGVATPPGAAPGVTAPGSSAQLLNFYVYRAQNSQDYDLTDVNGGDLAGVLWYVQHEVVIEQPPKFGISRILRYSVQVKAPQKLIDAGMNFGVRFAYDTGRCTGPGNCDRRYQEYGHFVGCNNLGEFPYPLVPSHYPGAIWYSLPGLGQCVGGPTGTDTCTYSFTNAGEILLTELEGTQGQKFWADAENATANLRRVQAAQQLFHGKYPAMPQDLPTPPCDFDYTKFYHGTADFR